MPDTDSTVDNELQKISNYTNPGKFNNFTQYRIKYNWVPILCDSLVWMDGWMFVHMYSRRVSKDQVGKLGNGSELLSIAWNCESVSSLSTNNIPAPCPVVEAIIHTSPLLASK